MQLTSLTVLTLMSLLAFSATAASVTVKWRGVVPTLDCASRAISNQTDANTLTLKCSGEFKVEPKSDTQPKTMVMFDI